MSDIILSNGQINNDIWSQQKLEKLQQKLYREFEVWFDGHTKQDNIDPDTIAAVVLGFMIGEHVQRIGKDYTLKVLDYLKKKVEADDNQNA